MRKSNTYTDNVLKQVGIVELALPIFENYYQGTDHKHVAIVLTSLGKAHAILGNAYETNDFIRASSIFLHETYVSNHFEVVMTSESW